MESLRPFPIVSVGHVPFAATNLENAVEWFVGLCQSKNAGVSVNLANAYCVAVASSDNSYRDVLQNRGVTLPDGQPVVDVMKFTAPTRISEGVGRVRGPSFFQSVMDQGQQNNLRHYFVGATDGTLALLTGRVRELYPNIKIAGTYSPPFAPLDAAYISDICERVRGAKPDVVWIGLGAPKQDFVSAEVANRLGICAAGVGAAFDFVAGTVAEAPLWIQTSRFEWAYRLFSEPRRLWKRYLFGNARFLWVGLTHLRANKEVVARQYGS